MPAAAPLAQVEPQVAALTPEVVAQPQLCAGAGLAVIPEFDVALVTAVVIAVLL